MNDTFLHFATNHLPVIGLVFGMGILATGRLKLNRALMRVGLGILAVSGAVALPVFLARELADGRIEEPNSFIGAIAGKDDDAFAIALPSVILAGAISVGALVLSRRRRMPVAHVASIVVSIGAVGVAGCLTWGAKLHSEAYSRPVSSPTALQLASLPNHHLTVDGYR